jgi:hypothetical protein
VRCPPLPVRFPSLPFRFYFFFLTYFLWHFVAQVLIISKPSTLESLGQLRVSSTILQQESDWANIVEKQRTDNDDLHPTLTFFAKTTEPLFSVYPFGWWTTKFILRRMLAHFYNLISTIFEYHRYKCVMTMTVAICNYRQKVRFCESSLDGRVKVTVKNHLTVKIQTMGKYQPNHLNRGVSPRREMECLANSRRLYFRLGGEFLSPYRCASVRLCIVRIASRWRRPIICFSK